MTDDLGPLAYDLLQDICHDILETQIGTLMFWNEESLRDDAFAQHVHRRLQQAASRMGWTFHDSSAAWERGE